MKAKVEPVALEAMFEQAIRRNPVAVAILERAGQLGMPNWYLGAGCLTQTVWNLAHGHEPTAYIRDYDLVYFDATDTSYEGEDAYIQAAKSLFADLHAEVEIRNEARVHLWFGRHFGYDIPPYESAEHAITTWPTTATSVGVRAEGGRWRIYAPYGLEDALSLVVRPNKGLVSQDVYEGKAARWLAHWPQLTVLPWETASVSAETVRPL